MKSTLIREAFLKEGPLLRKELEQLVARFPDREAKKGAFLGCFRLAEIMKGLTGADATLPEIKEEVDRVAAVTDLVWIRTLQPAVRQLVNAEK